MNGLLAQLFSTIDSKKRQLGGLLSDPVETIYQGIRNFGEEQHGLLDTQAQAYPWTGTNPREKPDMQARKALADAGAAQGMAGMTTPFKFPQDDALAIAQRNAAKPVKEGGLGLPANNTPMDRAKAMGYEDAYHGGAADIQQIDPKMFGTSTGANSAKTAFWAASDPTTAAGYAEYAAKSAPVRNLIEKANTYERLAQKSGNSKMWWDKYDDALKQAEELETSIYNNPNLGQNVMPLSIRTNKAHTSDAAGAEFVDMEGGVNNLLRQAKQKKKDVAILQNLADDVGRNARPTTHYGVINPAAIRSRFAAFDPARRNEADLLGSIDPQLLNILAGSGLLGVGAYGALKENQ